MTRYRLAVGLAAACSVGVACSWLAGLFFCVLAHWPLQEASPWRLLAILPRYVALKPVQHLLELSISLSCLLLGLLLGSVVKYRRMPSPYGTAHWATWRDIQTAGLLSTSGIILGQRFGRFLCMPGWEHVMCFAPSGSGKGIGIVIPNLLHWPDSAIVHDVKGENFRLTSGYRAERGQKVYFFNPGDPRGCTHRYNPFQFVSTDPGLRVDDIQKIAHLLLPRHDFWENEARTLLVGLALYLLDDPQTAVTFGNILCTIRQAHFFDFVFDVLARLRDTMDPVACMALNSFIQKAEKERSGVLSTLSAALEIWANPLIDAATSGSDFDLRQFKKERTTLYIGVSPNNLHRLRPLLQILYQQATDILTEKEPDPSVEPYGVLFLMDEFTSLGKMVQFEQASAYFRGYRVRFMMIIQDLPQLERHYEKAGLMSFMGMSKAKVTFASGDYQTADVISQYLGQYGHRIVNLTRAANSSGSSDARHIAHIARRLLLPQEILQLPPDEEIILMEGLSPIRAQKIRYFDEPIFLTRLRPPIQIDAIDPIFRDLKNIGLPPVRDMTNEEIDAVSHQGVP